MSEQTGDYVTFKFQPLRRQHREHKIKVLILDNLSTLSETLEDENDATAWNPLNSLVVALKKEGVATVLVHHTKKEGSGFRGSTNLATTLETIVALEKVEGTKASEGAAFRIRFDKNRANGKPHADGKTLRLQDGQWVCEVDPYEQAAEVVRMVQSRRYGTQQELADSLGVHQSTISRIFRAAEGLGLFSRADLMKELAAARDLKKSLAEPVGPEELDDDGPDIDL